MKRSRLYCFMLVIVLLALNAVSAENLSESEEKRKALNEKYDKLNLREKTGFVIDSSEKFLDQPGKAAEGDYTIAKVPPEMWESNLSLSVTIFFMDYIRKAPLNSTVGGFSCLF